MIIVLGGFILLKGITYLVLSVIIICTLTGCNKTTRTFGGTQIINLQPGQKLKNVTWKGDSLWLLSRPIQKDEVAENWQFKEYSNFGAFEGTVQIVESLK